MSMVFNKPAPLSEQHQFTINGRIVPYTLKRSTKAHFARLEVGSESGLTVVIPSTYQTQRVHLLLAKKQRWLTDKLGKYGHLELAGREPRVKAGDSVPYLGRNMKIETKENFETAGDVSMDEQSLVVSVRPGHSQISLALQKWYREEAQKKIGGMVEELSDRMNLTYNRVTLKGQKSIWGSCSCRHNLNFNWRLLMTPEPVIEYVLVHELAHLKEMNHSPKFWNIVERYCPDWKAHRKWLRDNAHDLAHTLNT
jgi:predicted metal-dependent hydrolase